jgi:hypothetical protein
MTLLDIELAGSTTRTKSALANDVPIEQLVTSMVTLVGDGSPAEGRWYAYRPGGDRLASHLTLAQAGVGDGDTIYVTRATVAIDPGLSDAFPTSPDNMSPSERAAQIIPHRATRRRRVLDTVRALLGTRSTIDAIDGSVWERTSSMWHWGDHRRRLEWMIGRPQLNRTVTIGVTSQADAGASSRLATALAWALASTRADRIMLIDGDPHRAGLTRLAAGRSQTITPLAAGSQVLDARFGSDPVTVLGCDLSGSDIPDFDVYRRTLDRIRANAGVVVIDCGPVGGSRLVDLCEQVVLVTDAPIDHRVRRMFRNRPTAVAVVPQPHFDMKAIDESLPSAFGAVEATDGLAGHEIAAVLADGWARLGASV